VLADLATFLVREGVLTREAASRALKAARGDDVASAALELRLAEEPELARALARAYECPAVDLSRSIISVSNLETVAPVFCRGHHVLPVVVGDADIALAMADPDGFASSDEIRFVTGKRVLRYAAVGTAILRAVAGLERAAAAGSAFWRGDRAPPMADPRSHLAIVRPTEPGSGVELPEASEDMEIIGLADSMAQLEAQEVRRQPKPTAPTPPRPGISGEPPGGHRATAQVVGPTAGKSVLVVDDDAEVRQLVARVLASMGCVVLQADDGQSGLALAREARPDLMILDAMMPGLHGFEVCRIVKSDPALRSIRIVLCSAIYRGTVGADARTAFGADVFLEKPFRLEELVRSVKMVLLGPTAAESQEERARREQAQTLWHAAAEALATERIPQAAELAREATAKDPWSAEAHYYLGHALSKKGLLFEAVVAFERSAELRPDVDASHQCLAQTYERLGFQKSAREAWARAIESCKDQARKKAMQARLMKLLGT
jgi:CheY-like chemotaxis protein